MGDINNWCQRISTWRQNKGFYTPPDIADQSSADLMLGKLMLVVTEIAEAAEAVRDKDYPNFAEELADACIRIFDIAGTVQLDLEAALEAKMRTNTERPYRHGRSTTL